MEFFWLAMQSTTFWQGPMVYAATALVLFAITGWFMFVLLSRRQSRSFLSNQSGAAAAIDFTMTLPIILLVVLLAVQYALLANAAIIVHYSAYSAARSARVHFFDANSAFLRVTGLGNAYTYYLANKDNAEREARDAAYMALISVSPAKSTGAARADSNSLAWRSIDNFLNLIHDSGASSVNTLKTKARYAFDPRNTKVVIDLDRSPGSILSGALSSASLIGRDEWPVTARVEYRFHLILPVARFFGERGYDGKFAADLVAEVTLL